MTFFKPHLGLGDAYVLAGMVRYLRQLGTSRPITFPCKLHNLSTVRELFEDLPDVYVLPVRDDDEMIEKAAVMSTLFSFPNVIPQAYRVSIGLHFDGGSTGVTFDSNRWVERFYEMHGLSPELSWTHFQLPPRTKQRLDINAQDIDMAFRVGKVAFVHQDIDRGFRINGSRIGRNLWWCGPIDPVPGSSAFDWLPHLYYADEVHCIDSSFLHLADRVFWGEREISKPRRLVLHAYARNSPVPMLKCNWEVLK